MARNYSNADEVLDTIWKVVEFGSFPERPKVDSIGIFGSQPLKVAVTWDDVPAVELLLDSGAAINAKHEGGILRYTMQLAWEILASRDY